MNDKGVCLAVVKERCKLWEYVGEKISPDVLVNLTTSKKSCNAQQATS